MFRLLCPSVVCPSRATTFLPQLSLLHRATRSVTTADRSYPKEPRVGVGVVILRPGPLQSQDTEILLIKRGKAPSKGLWSFPGGSQELGETLVQCALRESEEETGLTLRNNPRSAAADVISHDEEGHIEYHYTIVEVAAVPDDPAAVPAAASDVDDIKWTPVASLRQHKGLVVNAARIAEEAAERFELCK